MTLVRHLSMACCFSVVLCACASSVRDEGPGDGSGGLDGGRGLDAGVASDADPDAEDGSVPVDGATSLDGDVGVDGGESDGGPRCTTDIECDDGVFCNGAERCDESFDCTAGVPPSCDDGVACTIDACDGSVDTCASTPSDAACDDGLACTGIETCTATGCVAGAAVACSDGLSCTVDACVEPSGVCQHTGTDGDGDGYVALGCATGDDCDDLVPTTHPGAPEVCDGVDNDCDGARDDGFGCVLGSAPTACTTACATSGTRVCTAACARGPCVAATETCGNACDDDGDGAIDEGCAPANDTCGAAIPLSGASGVRSDLFSFATATVTDCAFGAEIWYRITLSTRQIFYVDTFGSTFDTKLSVRSSCGGTYFACEDDDCTTLQEQHAAVLPAGTYFVAVHSFSSSPSTGTVQLRWQTLPAASGTTTRILAPATFSGTTTGTGTYVSTCGGAGPENGYYFTSCPGTTRTVSASTCVGTSFDTVLSIVDATGTRGCNDDSCGLQSFTSGTVVGPGVAVIFVDGFGTSSAGAYSLTISGL